MSTDDFTAPTDDRLDRLLAARPSVASRRRARDAVESGKVQVDGLRCTEAGRAVSAGTRIQIDWARPGTGHERRRGREGMARSGLVILYEDSDMIAVDKPPGLLTDTASVEQHRTRDSVYKRLRAWLRPRGDRPFTVHRIDRDTSGVVLFARTQAAEANLRQQFRTRGPTRIYRAIVEGAPPFTEQTWTDFTRWHKGKRILEQVSEHTPGARETISRVSVVEQRGPICEIQVQIETGRRNQIRLQASLRGLPLVGERLYRDGPGATRAPRQLLHAWRLAVYQPTTGARVEIEAPLPPDWR